MEKLDAVTKCAHISECMITKKCHFGTPDRAGLKCAFFERHLKNKKEEKVISRENKKVLQFEKQIDRLMEKKNKKKEWLLSRIRRVEREFGGKISRVRVRLEKYINRVNKKK